VDGCEGGYEVVDYAGGATEKMEID
jgi:hypothetical protein